MLLNNSSHISTSPGVVSHDFLPLPSTTVTPFTSKKSKRLPQTSFCKPWSYKKCNDLEQHPEIRGVICLLNLTIAVKTSRVAWKLARPLNCWGTFLSHCSLWDYYWFGPEGFDSDLPSRAAGARETPHKTIQAFLLITETSTSNFKPLLALTETPIGVFHFSTCKHYCVIC